MNKINNALIITGGILNILGGIFHFFFYTIFNWKETLAVLDPVNRNIMIMLNYPIATFFLLFGIILLIFRHEIYRSKLGKAILISLGSVYIIRLVLEYILPRSSIIMGGILLVYLACHYIPLFTSRIINQDDGFSFQ